MKLGRVFAASLGLISGLIAGCSDPPNEPAQGGIVITVTPAPGASCNGAHGELQIPRDQRLIGALYCNLDDPACKPGAYVVVDGDQKTSVSCSVSKSGNTYNVSATLGLSGDSVGLTGGLSDTGGELTMTHRSAQTQVNLRGQCTINILPNKGVISPGKLWAQFSCPALNDPSSASGDQCLATGAFVFEKCGS
jgi:hypothetical protein